MVIAATRPEPIVLPEIETPDDQDWPNACHWPRNILEAYSRGRGPYTVQNVAFLLEEEPLELYNGWLVWQAMTDPPERRIAANIQEILSMVARSINFGQAYPDQVECVMVNGDTVKPDLCVISNQLFDTNVRPVKRPDMEGRHLKLFGSPELVVEIHSPSNTKAQERKKRQGYFASGAKIIWDVDPKREKIRVFEPDNQEHGTEYKGKAEISCFLFPGWKRQTADFFNKNLSAEQIAGQIAVEWRADERIKTVREILLRQATRRFKSEQLPADLETRLEFLTIKELNDLADALMESNSVAEWFKTIPTE